MDNQKLILGFTPYQWLVLFAAWLGWGFDVFDALLFNYVSRLCIPALLQISPNDPEIQNHITLWTGIITSLLLIGWAVGGILFGMLTDRLGRSRTLLITMLTYALATAACAASHNIWMLLLFRFIASLGIGGEWAAGAALVAETVPEKKRVTAGALLYTAAPMGLFLATFVTDLFTRQLDVIASDPEWSWRAVFLTGLIPAAVALLIRLKVREPDSWEQRKETPRLRELFTPEMRSRTIGGITLSAVALIAWWSISAFIPALASFLAVDLYHASGEGVLPELKARCLTTGTTAFNLGGLIGTLLTIPAAMWLGRRRMFQAYFLFSAVVIWVTFSWDFEVHTRLYMFGLLGLSLFGVFGAFTFYLPELFPSHLRGTGSGFCYNVARFVTALGPFIVASVAGSVSSTGEILDVVRWVALVPMFGFIVVMVGIGEEPRPHHG
jgi:MFS family permease